jgi:hypothetical protein
MYSQVQELAITIQTHFQEEKGDKVTCPRSLHLLMAGPGIENRSPGPRPVIFLCIVALTLMGVHFSGPGLGGPTA